MSACVQETIIAEGKEPKHWEERMDEMRKGEGGSC